MGMHGELAGKAAGLPAIAHSKQYTWIQEVTSATFTDLTTVSYQVTQGTNITSKIYMLIYEAVCRWSGEALEFLVALTLVKKSHGDTRHGQL